MGWGKAKEYAWVTSLLGSGLFGLANLGISFWELANGNLEESAIKAGIGGLSTSVGIGIFHAPDIAGYTRNVKKDLLDQVYDHWTSEKFENLQVPDHQKQLITDTGRYAFHSSPFTFLTQTDEFIEQAEAGDPYETALDLDLISPGAEPLYTDQDIDPSTIYHQLFTQFTTFLEDNLDDQKLPRIETALQLVEDLSDENIQQYYETLPQQIAEDLGELPETEEEAWDMVKQDLYWHADLEALNQPDSYKHELDEHKKLLDRFRPFETTEQLLEEPLYHVFELKTAEKMLEAAKGVGTCKRFTSNLEYYRELEEDPSTVMLGVRRSDDPDWVGISRNFLLESYEDGERRPALGIDAFEVRYKRGHEGGTPNGSCDRENFEDIVSVLALSAIKYGLENDIGYVLAGNRDGRVCWGARQIYSSIDKKLSLRKQGHDISHAYGFKEKALKRNNDQKAYILLEQPQPEEHVSTAGRIQQDALTYVEA